MSRQYQEINFDGLVGPTHNYAGLSIGNIASAMHAGNISNPKAAALQGLQKMRFLMEKGIAQAILPPHERPHTSILTALYNTHNHEEALKKATTNEALLANIYSASAMWTANAATVSCSADTLDQRTHFTIANLAAHFHRSMEAEQTYRVFKKIFSNEQFFQVHHPISSHYYFGDEGAANHGRLTKNHANKGCNIFVYGKHAFDNTHQGYPRRQSKESFMAIAEKHQLSPGSSVFLKQSSVAIDAGAFHNDVVSVTNEHVFLLHQDTFEQQENALQAIKKCCDFTPLFLQISNDEVSLKTAISSYLFNSQLITLPNQNMALLLPIEAKENVDTFACVQRLITDTSNPIQHAYYMNLRESMRNGGGPACLRLRVALSTEEQSAMHAGVIINEKKLSQLESIVKKYYRDKLTQHDFLDPEFNQNNLYALDEISKCLALEGIYDFQH